MTAILEKLTLYWAYPFVRYALVVGVLIALCSSAGRNAGAETVSFIGDGLSHVAFGAMAIAAVLQITNEMPLVMVITIISAVLLLRTGQNTNQGRRRHRHDLGGGACHRLSADEFVLHIL